MTAQISRTVMAIPFWEAPVRNTNYAGDEKPDVKNSPTIHINQYFQYRYVRGTYTACVDSYKCESDKKNLVNHCRDCTTRNVS